jgi:hypothetical protein
MAEKQGLRILIEQTSAFIEENPTDLVITRPVREPDGAGGMRDLPPNDLPAQRVRVVPASPSASVEVRNTSGETVSLAYSLVGLPDCDVQPDDSMVIDGLRYEVAVVVIIGGYVKRAELVRRG